MSNLKERLRQTTPIPIKNISPNSQAASSSGIYEDFGKPFQSPSCNSNELEINPNSQIHPFLGDVETEKFDRIIANRHFEIDSEMSVFQPNIPEWAIPDELKDCWKILPKQHAPAEADVIEKINVCDENDKFEISIDVSRYEPEDLKVATQNNVVSVSGSRSHESQKTDDELNNQSPRVMNAANQSNTSLYFCRKWTLPNACSPDDVISNLNLNGILTVTAPKKHFNSGQALY